MFPGHYSKTWLQIITYCRMFLNIHVPEQMLLFFWKLSSLSVLPYVHYMFYLLVVSLWLLMSFVKQVSFIFCILVVFFLFVLFSSLVSLFRAVIVKTILFPVGFLQSVWTDLTCCCERPGTTRGVWGYVCMRVTDGRTGPDNVAAGVGDVVPNCAQFTCEKIHKWSEAFAAAWPEESGWWPSLYVISWSIYWPASERDHSFRLEVLIC